MEQLLRLLPTRPQPIIVRYAAATLIVLVCWAVELGMEAQSGSPGLFLFMPSIFLAALLFDRGSGFYATILSTVLSIFALSPSGTFYFPPPHLLPLVLFLLIGFGMAAASEALRIALERSVAAHRRTTLMLDELNHRIRNNLALVGSVLELQMRSHSDESVRKAFASAVNRVHVIANAHDHLQPEAAQPSVDMCEYLTVICRNLGDALRDVRPIAVNVTCPGILLPTDKAVALGFIVNELVTNALKYAFPSDAGGTVSVSLRSSGASLTLEVTDNGKGCPEEGKEGMGSRIVRLLAQQLGSNIRREAAHPGCRVVLSIPNV